MSKKKSLPTTKKAAKAKKGFNRKVLANLKPFPPGVSGNPSGRPKKTKLTDASREWLEQVDPKKGKTNAELVAEAQGKEAKKGSTPAYNALADRTEGRPLQSVRLDAEVNLTTEDLREKLKAFTKKVRERLAGERREV